MQLILYANFVTALILGAMLFFAVVVTPVIFRALEGESRSRYLSVLFPVYYRVMMLASLAAALLAFENLLAALILFTVFVGFVFADRVLRPRIEQHRTGRDAGMEEDRRKFSRLHRLSVAINLAQMLGLTLSYILSAS